MDYEGERPSIEDLVMRDLGEMMWHLSYNYGAMDLDLLMKQYHDTMYLRSECNMKKVSENIYLLEGKINRAVIMTGDFKRDLKELTESVLDCINHTHSDLLEFLRVNIDLPLSDGKSDAYESRNASAELEYMENSQDNPYETETHIIDNHLNQRSEE